MPKPLAPWFADELEAAGLSGFAWNSDGTFFGRENLTAEQNAKLDAVIAAHDPNTPPPPPVPLSISRRQFFQAAATPVGGRPGMITQQEALDAVRHGAIPPLMQQGIDPLPPNEKFAAEMLLSGASEFERHHPLVEKFGEIMGLTSAQVDDIWRYAATL